jgi:DNA invertase Pin-like site-specific DNA recombinase
MKAPVRKTCCAVYTRVSTDERLTMEFNSLDAQREAALSYIQSQKHEGWMAMGDRYDDGGFSGGTMERPALQRLLRDVESGALDVIVVYKVDRLSRSLTDFARIVGIFESHSVPFVSVTQAFNTTTSMGRLTLNILLSFAQFEREVSAERTRDKVAASRRKGLWMGGTPPLGGRLGDTLPAVQSRLERRRRQPGGSGGPNLPHGLSMGRGAGARQPARPARAFPAPADRRAHQRRRPEG